MIQNFLNFQLENKISFSDIINSSSQEDLILLNDYISKYVSSLLEEGNNSDLFLKKIYLYGESSILKTFILKAIVQLMNDKKLSAVYIDLQEFIKYNKPENLLKYYNFELSAIDNIHVIAGDYKWESYIFHLLNEKGNYNKGTIFSGQFKADNSNFKSPDLISRLNGHIYFHISSLNKEELIKFVLNRAKTIGINISKSTAVMIIRKFYFQLITNEKILIELFNTAQSQNKTLDTSFLKEYDKKVSNN